MNAIIQRTERQNIGSGGAPTLARAPEATGGQNLAAGLDDVADMFNVMQDEVDTADAKNADVAFNEQLNDLLYNDETGYMYARGGDAMARREKIGTDIKALHKSSLAGLSPAARRKAESALTSRMQSADLRINQHAATERRGYLNSASEARITSSVQNAVFAPENITSELGVAMQEVRDIAAREGWSPEVLAVKEAEVRDQVYGGVINRMSRVDPVRALEYLRDNRGQLSGKALSALEGTLVPMAKEHQGRQLGASAALNGVDDTYLAAIRTAESGGNDRAKNPKSSASGRYQFIDSTWRMMMKKHPELGLTADGRFDPEQQERAIRAFTADNAKSLMSAGIEPTNANLYAAHFLGAGGAKTVLRAPDGTSLSSLLGPGVMRANPFLKGMTVSSFKAWSSRKGGGQAIGFSEGNPADGMAEILEIEDPVVRKAAFDEYNLRQGVAQAQSAARVAEVSKELMQGIEQGGSVADLDVETRTLLAGDVLEELRSYEKKKRSGEVIETDSQFFVDLSQMVTDDPAGFMAANPMEWRNQLDDTDFERFVSMQGQMKTEGPKKSAAPSVATMLSTSDAALRAAGITKTGKGSKPEVYAQFQAEITRWSSANPIDASDPVKLQARINSMLVPVVINPPGVIRGKDTQEGPAFQIDFDGKQYDPDDDITMDDLLDGTVTVNDIEVDPETMGMLAQLYLDKTGRDPSPQELLQAIIESGLYE